MTSKIDMTFKVDGVDVRVESLDVPDAHVPSIYITATCGDHIQGKPLRFVNPETGETFPNLRDEILQAIIRREEKGMFHIHEVVNLVTNSFEKENA